MHDSVLVILIDGQPLDGEDNGQELNPRLYWTINPARTLAFSPKQNNDVFLYEQNNDVGTSFTLPFWESFDRN